MRQYLSVSKNCDFVVLKADVDDELLEFIISFIRIPNENSIMIKLPSMETLFYVIDSSGIMKETFVFENNEYLIEICLQDLLYSIVFETK